MSRPRQLPHQVQKSDQIPSEDLDFTTLLPTPQQIETFHSYSTGNTPASSSASSRGDTYSPPMSTSLLPYQPLSERLQRLITWLDSLTSSTNMRKKLKGADFARWKAFLTGFGREEYCGALLYAAGKVARMKDRLRKLELDSTAVGSWKGGERGLWTGVPLSVLSWDEITEDEVLRMSTMAVKSGILQACKAMRALEVKTSAEETKGSGMEERADFDGYHEDNDEDSTDGSDDLEEFDDYSDPIDTGQIYSLEGLYIDAADRDYILSLPSPKREGILKEREWEAVKRQQDLQLMRALEASQAAVAERKRKSVAANDVLETGKAVNPDEMDTEMEDVRSSS